MLKTGNEEGARRSCENWDLSDENIPQGVNIISANRAFAWNTDSNGSITKAKPRFVARGFWQQLGVDYFEMFAPTPAT